MSGSEVRTGMLLLFDIRPLLTQNRSMGRGELWELIGTLRNSGELSTGTQSFHLSTLCHPSPIQKKNRATQTTEGVSKNTLRVLRIA